MHTIETNKPILAERITSLVAGGEKAAIFRAGLELEVWRHIAAGLKSAESICADQGWDPDATRILLDGLVALGLLAQIENGYDLTPEAETYLLPGLPTYMGDYVLTELSWTGPGVLSESIRRRKRPVTGSLTRRAMSTHWVGDYAEQRVAPEHGMKSHEAVWDCLGIEARDGLRVLNIGNGPGRKALALARKNPGVKVTLVDHPPMVEMGLELAARLGVLGQVDALPGDLSELDFGRSTYDVALLTDVTLFLSPHENRDLFERVYRALTPDGVLVLDTTVRRDTPDRLWQAVWLYVFCTHGDAYSTEDYMRWLEAVGFQQVKVINERLLKAEKFG